MNSSTNIKYPPNLVLVAVLSGCLTIVTSLIYVLLSVTFIVFRFNCQAFSSTTSTGAEYFWITIFRIYGLSSTCKDSFAIEKLTHEDTVLILVSITLAFSVVSIVAAMTLITIVYDEKQSRYLSWAVYAFVGSCVASLTIDITTASHFGVDYNYLTSIMRMLPPGSQSNYLTEVIRQGALWLMMIVMKGFVAPFINCILIIMLLVYLIQHQKAVNNDQHPVQKLGVINAFEETTRPLLSKEQEKEKWQTKVLQSSLAEEDKERIKGSTKNPEEAWAHPDIYNSSPFSRGPRLNGAFVEDESPPRSPHRRPDPPRSDYYSNQSFDRSNSWHRAQNSSTPQNARVFSYLEDTRRAAQPKSPQPQSPAVDKTLPAPWRRDPWPQPQSPLVPAPDYSPTQPRRLKSALKPGYM